MGDHGLCISQQRDHHGHVWWFGRCECGWSTSGSRAIGTIENDHSLHLGNDIARTRVAYQLYRAAATGRPVAVLAELANHDPLLIAAAVALGPFIATDSTRRATADRQLAATHTHLTSRPPQPALEGAVAVSPRT